jgi:hypothetical protein
VNAELTYQTGTDWKSIEAETGKGANACRKKVGVCSWYKEADGLVGEIGWEDS